MEIINLVNETIANLEPSYHAKLKRTLMSDYIKCYIIGEHEVANDLFMEKTCEHLEKIVLHSGKGLDKLCSQYIENLASLVKDDLVKSSRAKRYYDNARLRVHKQELTVEKLLDYTRVMLCLYTVKLNGEEKPMNIDFSVDCLNPSRIVMGMKSEKKNGVDVKFVKLAEKERFDLSNRYSVDSFSFLLTIILVYSLKNNQLT